jgi:hypothetical protein
MPNCAALSAATSTMSASTNTCARRTSRRSMIARRLLYSGSGPMTMSALFAVSAWMVRPPGSVVAAFDTPVKGFAADGGGVGCAAPCGMPAPVAAAASVFPMADGCVVDAGVSAPPDMSARSVCATRAASAFFRYTMNMLPPGRPGVSSCSIRAFTRAARAELSERSMTLLLRGSATMVTRCCTSEAWPAAAAAVPASAPSRRLTSGTRSSAEAYLSVTIIGSPAGAWSSDATIFSMRRRFSA